VDAEASITPNTAASTDDTTGADDEDGVTVPASITPGQSATVTAYVNNALGATAYLNAWIDFNNDGVFNDSLVTLGGERLESARTIAPGTTTATAQNITFTVPSAASVGTQRGVRLRVSDQSATSPANGVLFVIPQGSYNLYQASSIAALATFTNGSQAGAVNTSFGGGAGHIFNFGGKIYLVPDGSFSIYEHTSIPQLAGTGTLVGTVNSGFGGGADHIFGFGGKIYVVPQGSFNIVEYPSIAAMSGAGTPVGSINSGFGGGADEIFVFGGKIYVLPQGSFNIVEYTSIAAMSGTGTNVGSLYSGFGGGQREIFSFDGAASTGEIEDYVVAVNAATADYGDYSGFAAATQTVDSAIRIGTTATDAEASSPANSTANGDDTSGADDEDISMPTFTVGTAASLTVPVTISSPVTSAQINVFVDWNGDGDVTDTNETQTAQAVTSSGNRTFNLTPPVGTAPGTKYLRIRFTEGSTAPAFSGASALKGEVEDYALTVNPSASADYGDYSGFAAATQTANSAIRIGTLATDAEAASPANSTATGDDITGDDEDLTMPTFSVGSMTTLAVPMTITGGSLSGNTARVNVFVDWNGDGDVADTNESLTAQTVSATGSFNFSLTPPAGTAVGTKYLRIRAVEGATHPGFSGTSLLKGEVEDYAVTVNAAAVTTDFGDWAHASNPSGAGTTTTSSTVNTNLRIGASVDAEASVTPNASATADGGDEDGVAMPASVTMGSTVTIPVVVFNNSGNTGFLHSWIDFNNDGNFNNSVLSSGGERLAVVAAVDSGTSPKTVDVTFTVPTGASAGDSRGVRFRFTDSNGTTPTGISGMGEVEDYVVAIRPGIGQPCDGVRMEHAQWKNGGAVGEIYSGGSKVGITLTGGAYGESNGTLDNTAYTAQGANNPLHLGTGVSRVGAGIHYMNTAGATATVTMTFSQPVTNPVVHLDSPFGWFDIDFVQTPTAFSVDNKFVSSDLATGVVRVIGNPSAPGVSSPGSVHFTGTYSSISWNTTATQAGRYRFGMSVPAGPPMEHAQWKNGGAVGEIYSGGSKVGITLTGGAYGESNGTLDNTAYTAQGANNPLHLGTGVSRVGAGIHYMNTAGATATVTMTFSQPVTNPVVHLDSPFGWFDIDFVQTPTAFSVDNKFVSSDLATGVVRVIGNPSAPGVSSPGSVHFTGTYSSISWNTTATQAGRYRFGMSVPAGPPMEHAQWKNGGAVGEIYSGGSKVGITLTGGAYGESNGTLDNTAYTAQGANNPLHLGTGVSRVGAGIHYMNTAGATATVTMTFSQPVTNPVVHLDSPFGWFDIDFVQTPTAFSVDNKFVSSDLATGVVRVIGNPSAPGVSSPGSVHFTGTYSSISWNTTATQAGRYRFGMSVPAGPPMEHAQWKNGGAVGEIYSGGSKVGITLTGGAYGESNGTLDNTAYTAQGANNPLHLGTGVSRVGAGIHYMNTAGATATVTMTFSQPVTNPVVHLDSPFGWFDIDFVQTPTAFSVDNKFVSSDLATGVVRVIGNPSAPGVSSPGSVHFTGTYSSISWNTTATQAGRYRFGMSVPAGGLNCLPPPPTLDFGDWNGSGVATATTSSTVNTNLRIGASVDAEASVTPNASATTDDTTGGDDEDGVALPSSLTPGATVTIPVVLFNNTGANAYLNAWIDFNNDGSFNNTVASATGSGEKLEVERTIITGSGMQTVNVTLEVPSAAVTGSSLGARFRLTSVSAATAPTGAVGSGEVEDYTVRVETTMPCYGVEYSNAHWEAATGLASLKGDLFSGSGNVSVTAITTGGGGFDLRECPHARTG
jgi:hypothetical protein